MPKIKIVPLFWSRVIPVHIMNNNGKGKDICSRTFGCGDAAAPPVFRFFELDLPLCSKDMGEFVSNYLFPRTTTVDSKASRLQNKAAHCAVRIMLCVYREYHDKNDARIARLYCSDSMRKTINKLDSKKKQQKKQKKRKPSDHKHGRNRKGLYIRQLTVG